MSCLLIVARTTSGKLCWCWNPFSTTLKTSAEMMMKMKIMWTIARATKKAYLAGMWKEMIMWLSVILSLIQGSLHWKKYVKLLQDRNGYKEKSKEKKQDPAFSFEPWRMLMHSLFIWYQIVVQMIYIC
ncbi:PSY1 [Saccharomyces cerevisiae synthetic construct]|uniref:Putative platinum sensitivity protein 1 n=2 Tax=Saccharomyces cerevisiae TaxID=4932 RepID=PSY1_YEAST|nr:RecName: Full=Putative platinum sensitivity protein 1 [Saccharomyces cerevisiae S288C]WNV94236.1 PSY1 [Saccharomyces cerevisiae synthetic construct]CAA81912.1 unnamed protein product [Saccharomyces cerevisiae]CAY81013.1 Psy1p [Saccharomyces cerevisiae EC1118]